MKRKNRFRNDVLKLSAIAIFVLATSLSGRAQGVLAEIRGAVTDASGSVIPHATVMVLDTAKGWKRIGVTDAHGEFDVPELVADSYELSVESQGFQKSVRRGILLQTGQQARINVVLQLGSVDQTVTVTGDASQVQTENATLGAVVDDRKIAELPLNGRQFWQLAQLVPNAYPPISGSSLAFRGGFNIAGQSEVNNNYLLDGIDNSDEATMQPVVSPSVDGIREFKVLTGVYNAEYGRFSGGQILITTKSGSNAIHGSAYEFYRTSVLDAENYFSPGSLPPYHRNQYGASFGGPIQKDRTFFFGTYEGLRLSQQISAVAVVPTDQERDDGNLSDLVSSSGAAVKVINPTTGVQYPGNQLQAFDPVSSKLLAYYPRSNYSSTSGNYLFSEMRTQNQDQFSTRIDRTLFTGNTIYGSYQYENLNAFEPSNSLCGSSVLPGFGCTTPELDQAISIHDTHVFSPSIINELRVGYNRIRTNRNLEDAKYGDVLDTLGIPTSGSTGVGTQSGLNVGVPSVTVSGYATLGGATNLPQGRRDNTYNIADSLSWTFGKHSFKFGGDFKRFIYNLIYYQYGRGVFTFNGEYTGSALADFLLGYLRSTSRCPGDPAVHSFTASTDFFALDQWQLTPNVTVTYGARYELNFPEGERLNRISTFDPTTGYVPVANGELLTVDASGNLENIGTSPLIGQVWRLRKTNFAPRVSVAVQPFGNEKTVIRSGYGIFYDEVVAGNGISQMWRGIPFRTRQQFLNTASSSYPRTTPTLTWTSPFPSGVSSSGGYTPNGINPNYNTAYIQEWSLSIDRELQKDLLLELSYLGSHGSHLQESYNLNQPTPGAGTIQTRRPFTQWGSITWVNSSGGSSFNSFAAQLTRRYSQGMTLLASYTYGHSLDDAPYTGALQNPQNIASQWASSDFDIRHRFVASFTYELPFGTGKAIGSRLNALSRQLISGWQTNGIFVFQTGVPFTVTTTKDISNTGLSSTYANLVAGKNPHVAHPSPTKWFNTAAFSDTMVANTYAYGTSGRNPLAADGVKNIDFGLYRRFQTVRHTQLEFRTEVFNLLNHPNFSAPNTNVEGGSSFGAVSSTSSSNRQTQFALKVIF